MRLEKAEVTFEAEQDNPIFSAGSLLNLPMMLESTTPANYNGPRKIPPGHTTPGRV